MPSPARARAWRWMEARKPAAVTSCPSCRMTGAAPLAARRVNQGIDIRGRAGGRVWRGHDGSSPPCGSVPATLRQTRGSRGSRRLGRPRRQGHASRPFASGWGGAGPIPRTAAGPPSLPSSMAKEYLGAAREVPKRRERKSRSSTEILFCDLSVYVRKRHPAGHGVTTNQGIYRFDRFRLDPWRGVLARDDGTELHLRPKAFALLKLLLDHPGRLFGREELLEGLWPGVIVTDDSLTQCVGDLRQALGDRAAEILRTVPRRGYRLAAEVGYEAAERYPSRWPPPPLPRRRRSAGSGTAGAAGRVAGAIPAHPARRHGRRPVRTGPDVRTDGGAGALRWPARRRGRRGTAGRVLPAGRRGPLHAHRAARAAATGGCAERHGLLGGALGGAVAARQRPARLHGGAAGGGDRPADRPQEPEAGARDAGGGVDGARIVPAGPGPAPAWHRGRDHRSARAVRALRRARPRLRRRACLARLHADARDDLWLGRAGPAGGARGGPAPFAAGRGAGAGFRALPLRPGLRPLPERAVGGSGGNGACSPCGRGAWRRARAPPAARCWPRGASRWKRCGFCARPSPSTRTRRRARTPSWAAPCCWRASRKRR
jgi:DNA-binding winged helix-turn-helix (wHTH) protein